MRHAEEGLYWWTEESLVHVLDPVLYVSDGVDVVCLMWCVFSWGHTVWGRASCGFGGGCDGKSPQVGDWIPFAWHDKALLVPDAAGSVGESRGAACIAEHADGYE